MVVVVLLLLVGFAVAQDAPHYGIPIDWSSRHVISSAADNVDLQQAIRRDPRQVYNWMLHNHKRQQQMSAMHPANIVTGKSTTTKKGTTSVDWSFPLGAGTVPIHAYPAKYSFDSGTSALTAANCTSDYVAYALNVSGSSSQPNLVQFQNIYAGTVPATGLCGTAPTVGSAYNVTTATAGGMQTSPVLSLDGLKVAFVESGTGASVFHVLTWGTSGSNGAFSSNVYTAVKPSGSMATTTIANSPAGATESTTTVTITTTAAHGYAVGQAVTIAGVGVAGYDGTFVITSVPSSTTFTYTASSSGLASSGGGTASAGNNATMTSLAYSTSTTTYSSPYIDYSGDRAFFGDDNGNVYVTTCVFYCSGAPAIASGWPIQVAAGVKMSPPVWDSTSNKIFVGGSDGKLYSLNLATCPTTCTPASITVGVNNANGGVFDGVLLDSTFETLFVFTGDNGTAAGAMTQTDVNFSFTSSAVFGASPFPIYAGALDDAYYQNQVGQTVSATVPGGHVWSCGALGGSKQPDMYWSIFTANAGTLSVANPPKMSTAPTKKNVPGNPGIGCNPLTEFKNGTSDRLFLSQSTLSTNKCNGLNPTPDGCVMMYDISAATLGSSPNAWTVENNGTSGIVVDNASGSSQASSVYFANEGTSQCTTGAGTASYCAVKLTQSAFQ